MANSSVTLLSLPWEDVLFKHILPFLNLKDLFILRSVSTNYKELVTTFLEVKQNINLTKYKSFDNIALEVLLSCRRVKTINVSGCQKLGDAMFARFLSNNHNIVEINLSFCFSFGNKTMQSLILSCKNLKSLKMASCMWLSTGAVDALTYHQDKLETVDFSKCVNLSARSIHKFVVKFYRLKNLALAHIRGVTDTTIITIANHCPELETINIIGCNVSASAIRLLMSKCKKLTLLVSVYTGIHEIKPIHSS